MSFGVNFIGTPDAIKRELAAYAERVTGQSKEEFDAVRPAIEAVIDRNIAQGVKPVLHVEAHGHATIVDGLTVYADAAVHVRRVSGAALAI